MSAQPNVNVLAVLDSEGASVNRIRRNLGAWLQRMEDTNWQVNGSGGPDYLDLSDLNQTVIRLREARAAVAELIEAQQAFAASLAPIINELHNGKVNGSWPPTPGDMKAIAAEIVRLYAPIDVALAKARGEQP